MVRTQVRLADEQHEFLKLRSYRTGTSVSAQIREAIAKLQDDEVARRERARQLLGAFEADRTDVAKNHDAYLAEAFAR
jgi:Arc/MetJ-type ribon-helix-helix transcriptional regulator